MSVGRNRKFGLALLISTLSMSILISCAGVKTESKKIEAIDFKGISEVSPGNQAELAWQFSNADFVKVNNYNAEFRPTDTLLVKPKEDMQFKIVAYNKKDSLKMDWHVFVKNPSATSNQANLAGSNEVSASESEYLCGVIAKAQSKGAIRVKATRWIYPFASDSLCRVEAIVLDKNGNFIDGLDKGDANWFASSYTGAGITEESVSGLEDANYSNSSMELSVLIDNSAASNNTGINKPLLEMLSGMKKDDIVSIYKYNQKFEPLIAIESPNNAALKVKSLSQLVPSGLNSSYRSAWQVLNEMSSRYINLRKALVLITYSADNSSITLDADDAAQLARKLKIPVYVIGIGSAVESYSLKYLCDFSGGRYYSLTAEDSGILGKVLAEIALSQKRHYILNVTISQKYREQFDKINTEVSVYKDGTSINDRIRLITKPETQFSSYQALAAFSYQDSTLDTSYMENIRALVSVLKANPKLAVELVGHSGLEGNEDFNKSISLIRAQEVRRTLLKLGAGPEQIRLRAEGSSKPVYYMGTKEWQALNNRRVELRWLDPSLLPFEILAQTAETETKAISEVETWERAGYRSYFERIISEGNIVYRVKLWGYPTELDAVQALEKINKDKKSSYVVQ